MKILITGGLGYVGGRLANYLKQSHPDTDIVITSTRSSFPEWASEFSVAYMNLLESDSIKKAIEEASPDVIIHLSSIAQDECQDNSQKAHAVNVEGTKRLLEQASKNNVRKMIYFSTFQVYGSLEGKIIEAELPIALTEKIYPKTKWETERVIKDFPQIESLILRLSNGYGAPADIDVAKSAWGLVFNAFCLDCFRKGEIAPKGWAVRDFVTLHDVARAVDFFLFDKASEWGDGLYNLGGECCLSIVDVAYKVSEVFEKFYKKKIHVCEPPPTEGHQKFDYSVDKLKSAGFVWVGNMEEEIHQTLKMSQEYLAGVK